MPLRYRKLHSSTSEIRLVHIHPNTTVDGFIQCRLQVAGVYAEHACLSYLWGPQKPKKKILVNGESFHIRRNLWPFLNLSRRRKGRRAIWIDAICVDQDNVQERNHQVSMMGEIYKSANEVLVWLGEGEPGLEIALNMLDGSLRPSLSAAEHDFRSRLGIRRSNVKSFKTAMTKLTTLTYWNRIWIKQEILLNSKTNFMYGRSNSRYLQHMLCQCEGFEVCQEHNAYKVGRLPCTKIFDFGAWDPPSCSPRPLLDLVRLFSSSGCTEVRDRVYGLLSMAIEGGAFQIDYSISTIALFEETLRIADFKYFYQHRPELEYLIQLVQGLGLSDSDLQKSHNLRGQKPFRFVLESFAVFADNRFRRRNRRKRSPHPESKRTPDRLHVMTVCGERDAHERTIPMNIGVPNLGVPDVNKSRFILNGASGLLPHDIIFKVSTVLEPSNLFLVGRLRIQHDLELEIVAVAESDRQLKSFYGGSFLMDEDNRIDLKIFDAPAFMRGTIIKLVVQHDHPEKLVAVHMVCDIRMMALLVNSLSLQTTTNEERMGSWRTEKMCSMRNITLSALQDS